MMGCQYLEVGKNSSICTASMALMVPSVYEVELYCTTEEHYRCPILLSYLKRWKLRDRNKEAIKGTDEVYSR